MTSAEYCKHQALLSGFMDRAEVLLEEIEARVPADIAQQFREALDNVRNASGAAQALSNVVRLDEVRREQAARRFARIRAALAAAERDVQVVLHQ